MTIYTRNVGLFVKSLIIELLDKPIQQAWVLSKLKFYVKQGTLIIFRIKNLQKLNFI